MTWHSSRRRRQIPLLAPLGARQLAADLSYVTNVCEALGIAGDAALALTLRVLNTPADKLRDRASVVCTCHSRRLSRSQSVDVSVARTVAIAEEARVAARRAFGERHGASVKQNTTNKRDERQVCRRHRWRDQVVVGLVCF